MVKVGKGFLTILLLASAAMAATSVKQDADLEAGRRAFEASDYAKAIQALQAAAAKDPRNGDVHLLLAKSYLEMEQLDAAIRSARRPWLSIRRVRHTMNGLGRPTAKRPIRQAGPPREYRWRRKRPGNSRGPCSLMPRISRPGRR